MNFRINDVIAHRAGASLNYYIVESIMNRHVYEFSPLIWNGRCFVREGMLPGDKCEYTFNQLMADEAIGEDWRMVRVRVEN